MTLEQTLVSALQETGGMLRAAAFEPRATEWKKEGDPVTPMDRMVESHLRSALEGYRCNFVGEEYGSSDNGADLTLHIDPIDGTKDWVRHGFYCATSIGVEDREGNLVGGIVHDFMRDIMYVGFEGRTYILHDGKKHPLGHEGLPKLRISVDYNPALRERLERGQVSVIEQHGSIALGMAEVAAGNLDGMISASIGKGNTWDVAGGLYLLQCKGIRTWDSYGQPFGMRNASNGLVALSPRAEGILDYGVFREAA